MHVYEKLVIDTDTGGHHVLTLYKWLARHLLFRVKTYNEETGEFEYTQIKEIENEMLPTTIVKSFSNKHVCCTPDTLILTEKEGWKRAGDMVKGDRVMNNIGNYLDVLDIQNDQKVRSTFSIKLHQGTNIVSTAGIIK